MFWLSVGSQVPVACRRARRDGWRAHRPRYPGQTTPLWPSRSSGRSRWLVTAPARLPSPEAAACGCVASGVKASRTARRAAARCAQRELRQRLLISAASSWRTGGLLPQVHAPDCLGAGPARLGAEHPERATAPLMNGPRNLACGEHPASRRAAERRPCTGRACSSLSASRRLFVGAATGELLIA